MFVDGDNAQPSLIEHVLAETAKYGIVTTRRIYGEWTTPQMRSGARRVWTCLLPAGARGPVNESPSALLY